MTETPLETALLAMKKMPEDDDALRAVYARLAEAELSVALKDEPGPGSVKPRLVEVEGQGFVLAFSDETHLATFAEGPAPMAAFPGRVLAQTLAAQGIGLALNLGTASEALLPPDAMAWVAEMVDGAPEEHQSRPVAVYPPGTLPEGLMAELDRAIARMGGLAAAALLVLAEYEDGNQQHLLALIDAQPGAEEALSGAVQQALRFSGVEAGSLDVTFLGADDPATERMARVALRFDIPAPEAPSAPEAPGSNPEKPPKLR